MNTIQDISIIRKETKAKFQSNWEIQLNRILSTKDYYLIQKQKNRCTFNQTKNKIHKTKTPKQNKNIKLSLLQ